MLKVNNRKTKNLKLENRPLKNLFIDGRLVYKSGPPVPMYAHLDDYTIDELSQVSDYLESIDYTTRTNDPVYQKFLGFCNNNEIWFSNSNSRQPSSATYLDSSTANASLCNQAYKCSFDGEQDRDKFMFLIVKGILHDYDTNHKRLGLTMECVHSIPTGYVMGTAWAQWWNTGTLRALLQPGGTIYNQIPSAITSKIKPCKKWSYDRSAIATTADYIFLPSYAEQFQKEPYSSWTSKPAFASNGRDSSGNQTFNPTSPITEGYCYEWNWYQAISGTQNNSIYVNRGKTNSNAKPDSAQYGYAWERSTHPSGGGYFLNVNLYGSIDNWNYYYDKYGVAPCFCI